MESSNCCVSGREASHARDDTAETSAVTKPGEAMKAGWIGLAATAASLLAFAGCSGDLATEIRTNAQVRDRVMGAIVSDGALAQQMTQRLLASDSLRTRVVETMLQDSPSAQYVLARIGHQPDAVDLVLQAATSDSVGREHVMTLLKGMQMALKSGAQR